MGARLPEAAFEAMRFSGDSWHLAAEGAQMDAPHLPSIFVLGNGFIGVRGPGESANAPRVYLNGVFERVPIDYHEGAYGYARESDTRLAVADATRLDIAIDGVALAGPDMATLDMRGGLLILQWNIGGVTIRSERLISFARTAIVATRLEFTATSEARISLRGGVSDPAAPVAASEEAPAIYDPRVTPEMAESPWQPQLIVDQDGIEGRVDGLKQSGFGVAALVTRASEEIVLTAGETRTIMILAAYHAARDEAPASLLAAARRDLEAAAHAGFDALVAEQATWLGAFWEDAAVHFRTSPKAEQAVRHCLFQLVQAVGRDGASSIAAKGQTGEGYEGHVFWDADSYVLPVFVYTRPEIARAMLAWRISKLGPARENARALGHARGALYPWRSIAGRECSAFFPAGSAQYHINADIGYALRLYVETTGDTSILAEGGAEMLAETARIWLDLGFHDPARGDAFVINGVTGPDEYTALVDNNLYTNMMAAEHLRYAADMAADQLAPGEAEAMRRAADSMLLPMDEARGIYAQDDSFFTKPRWPIEETPADQYPLLLHFHPLAIYRHRVAKQADAVLATVLLRDCFDTDMRRRMLDEYEGITVHDSTLSASAFAAAAASVGDATRAFRYWRVSTLTDLEDLFGNSDHGLHMAALAGSWNALAIGFGGLRTLDGKLGFRPIAVPELHAYAFRIRYRGRAIEVSVEGDRVTYTLVSGDAVVMWHGDDEFMLGAEPVVREVVA
ncbi:glycoside hydrolase family 65 protein [Sphingomonas sp. LaA6.9]|uniref:glycoside hydrolase family 65 protein n=1 Tax=Sphingomonas sp. LaA6.9 TaxID=2919914 RepID=UPI001F4F5FF2|nr:glycosyl hydrolase family 65 protein [Sphingomonas sp. LaA6.9]MCJ8156740.1 glycoside hydrolase family 65 protein [Sphingomonas sp. LaA6.9]